MRFAKNYYQRAFVLTISIALSMLAYFILWVISLLK